MGRFDEYTPPGLIVGDEKMVIEQAGGTWTTTINNIILNKGILSDITITTPQDGDALIYDSGDWVNGAVASSVDSLSDTTITTPQDGDALIYDTGGWINIAVAAGNPFNQDLNTTDTPTFAGIASLSKSSDSTNSVMIIGGNAVITGDNNIFIGSDAGLNTTGESSSIFLGHQSGYYADSGNANICIGYQSGYGVNGQSSYYNIFLGYLSGNGITIGMCNVAIGFKSGQPINTGESNTFVGESTGRSNTDGGYNTFVGSNAGRYNISGANNVFVGYLSGYYSIGTNNVCIGNQSGYGVSGQSYNNNIFLGYQSGKGITTGGNNIFLGEAAGDNVTTGSNIICFGKNAQPSAVDSTHQMIIGDAIDMISVGIGGNNNPQYELDVIGDINYTGSTYKDGTELTPIVASDTEPADTSIFWIDTSS